MVVRAGGQASLVPTLWVVTGCLDAPASSGVTGRRSARGGIPTQSVGTMETSRAGLGSEIAGLGSERARLGPETARLSSEAARLGSESARLVLCQIKELGIS